MNTYYHSQSSVKKWGGQLEDYLPIHSFLDSTKQSFPDVRHRAFLHNAFGIFLAEKIFGNTITNGLDKRIPVREICEQHIIEDLGFIPTIEDWARCMPLHYTKWAGGHINLLLKNKVYVPNHIKDKILEYQK